VRIIIYPKAIILIKNIKYKGRSFGHTGP